jgi:hypothetical protein
MSNIGLYPSSITPSLPSFLPRFYLLSSSFSLLPSPFSLLPSPLPPSPFFLLPCVGHYLTGIDFADAFEDASKPSPMLRSEREKNKNDTTGAHHNTGGGKALGHGYERI